MDTIPERTREKLVRNEYDSLAKLPNDKNFDRWKCVKDDCGLTNPELTELMNIRFPVQQGNIPNHFLIHSSADLCPFHTLLHMYYSLLDFTHLILKTTC